MYSAGELLRRGVATLLVLMNHKNKQSTGNNTIHQQLKVEVMVNDKVKMIVISTNEVRLVGECFISCSFTFDTLITLIIM